MSQTEAVQMMNTGVRLFQRISVFQNGTMCLMTKRSGCSIVMQLEIIFTNLRHVHAYLPYFIFIMFVATFLPAKQVKAITAGFMNYTETCLWKN